MSQKFEQETFQVALSTLNYSFFLNNVCLISRVPSKKSVTPKMLLFRYLL